MRSLKYEQHSRLLLYGYAFAFLICLAIALVSNSYLILCLPFAALFFLISVDNIELLFLFLLFLIPFSIEFEVTKSLSTDLPDEPLMWLITAALGLALLFKKGLFQRLQSLNHIIWKLLLVSLIWIFISTAFSSNILISFKHLISKTWYISSFFILPVLLFSKPEHIKRMAFILIAGMLTVVLYSTIRQIELGFSFLRVNETVSPFFRNHVNYSAMLASIIPLLIIAVQYTKKSKLKWLLYIAITVSVGNLIFAYSRGAWLGLICCPLFSFILKRRMVKHALTACFLVVFVGGVLFIGTGAYKKLTPSKERTIYHTDFKEHLEATYKLTDLSFAERFHRWIAGVRMTKHKPIFGFGPNTFSTNYKAYTLWKFETWVSDNPEKSSIHNYYLLQFAEQGIVGGCLFLALIFFAFIKVEHLYHTNKSNGKIVLGIGYILVVISTELLVNDLIETDKIGSLFFLCLAGLVILEKSHRPTDKNVSPQRTSNELG